MTEVDKSSLMAQKMQINNTSSASEIIQIPRTSKDRPNYTWLLLQKNIILTVKNPKNLLFLMIAPFLLSAFMYMFQSMAEDQSTRSWLDHSEDPVTSFPHCEGFNCTSLYYTTVGDSTPTPQWIDHTINYIKKYSDSGVGGNITKGNPIVTLDDWTKVSDSLLNLPNQTQIGIVFCVKPLFPLFNCSTDPKSRGYYLLLNKTDSFSTIFAAASVPLPTDPISLSLKVLIDNAIIDYQTTKNFSPPKMSYKTQQFPVLPTRFLEGFDIITQTGAFYYMITPLFAFLFIQNEIVRQKQYRLRQGLNVFGASHFGYWFSWFIISLIYSLVVSLSTFVSGIAFQFNFFHDTPFLIIFIMMFSFCMAMQMVGYFLAAVTPNLKAANSVSYGLVLFSIVVESFMTNDSIISFLYEDEATTLIIALRTVLTFYPPFSYTKIFTSITQYSGFHFSILSSMWERGPGYTWEIFEKEIKGFTMAKTSYTEYSSAISILVLWLNVLFFILLTWYFDNVAESNRGSGQPFYFFLKPSYWGCVKRKRKAKLTVDDLRNPTYNILDEQESVSKERIRVLRNFNNNQPALGMRIKGLSKTFKGTCSKNTVQALRNLTLEIEPNELMSILGHNGAGKTTLINILTGIISPDQNPELEIIINNCNIMNIGEVRKHIGVCPQFDILWGEMTAEEHLRLFGRLKGIPNSYLDRKINQVLKFVSLHNQKKNRVSSFSGGMKRRLSLAVAAIGDPKIIFLDEPTTGLDPKVRQQVWTLIQKLKKHKSVILTTHSMQQADILSDRISILVKGRLKCVGSSIYLKDNYGSGYRIALNVVDNKSVEVMRLIKKIFPEAIEVDSNGGNLLVGIHHYQNLLEFVKMLENKEASGLDEYTLKQNIKDWNVSHTTLEEVFMEVTKEKQE